MKVDGSPRFILECSSFTEKVIEPETSKPTIRHLKFDTRRAIKAATTMNGQQIDIELNDILFCFRTPVLIATLFQFQGWVRSNFLWLSTSKSMKNEIVN